MAIEKRLLVSWSDVRAIVFECGECHLRVAVPPGVEPNKLGLFDCPSGHKWGQGPSPTRPASIIRTLRQTMTDQAGFNVLLQFDEPAHEGTGGNP